MRAHVGCRPWPYSLQSSAVRLAVQRHESDSEGRVGHSQACERDAPGKRPDFLCHIFRNESISYRFSNQTIYRDNIVQVATAPARPFAHVPRGRPLAVTGRRELPASRMFRLGGPSGGGGARLQADLLRSG